MTRGLISIVIAVSALVLAVAPAFSQERNALVVGMDDYKNVKKLTFAVKDATDIHHVLTTDLGFPPGNAELVIDKGFAEVQSAWDRLMKRLEKNGGLGVFYFSGHGIELGGRNFLIAKDAVHDPSQSEIVQKSALDLQKMLKDVSDVQEVRPGVRMIFILDACRENPFQKSGAANPGLAPPKFISKEVFIMYSAGIGQEAIDGPKTGPSESRPNSVYVNELLPLLKRQDRAELALSDMAKVLSRRVYEAALKFRVHGKWHYQTPAYYDQFLSRATLTGIGVTARPVFDNQDLKIVAVDSPEAAAEGRSLEAGAIIKECLFCPELLALAPQAGVRIGSPDTDPDHESYEALSDGAQLTVQFTKPVAIGRFEVTKGEWNACVQDTRDELDKTKKRPDWACDDKGYVFGDDGRHFEREPASDVSWDEAQRFVGWLNHKIGASPPKYRLPTETEWEFAARAGNGGRYAFSLSSDTPHDEAKKLCTYANGADQSIGTVTWLNRWCSDNVGRKGAQAGSFEANRWGLHDMMGNVAEWVEDCWQDNYDKTPTDGTAFKSNDCSRRVIRGGSWRSRPAALRSAARNAVPPTVGRATLGFRVVRELE